jgi:1-phosphofructokinase family hexose kinase
MIATVTLNPSLDEWMRLPTLTVGALNRAEGFSRYPGGKGLNVSRVVRELGGTTHAFGLAGGDDGDILRRGLTQLRIPHTFLAVHGTTRNNYKIQTARPRALTEINLPGPRVPAAVLAALRRRLLALRPRPGCVALCGSLPPGAPAATYRDWSRWMSRARLPVVLDSSGAALAHGLAARPWLVKPNRQEAEELLGRRLVSRRAAAQAARELIRRGCRTVIVSLGAEGAVLAGAGLPAVWFARAPRIKVGSAVGAGDSLIGGFLAGWARGGTVLEAFRLGIAAGAATAMTPGTELCHRADVQRLLPRVTLYRL